MAAPAPQQPIGPAPAPARYAEHAVPRTIQTATGGTVAVPPVPVQASSADATQLIDMGNTSNDQKPTSDSGFQMAEEYYRD